jgi:hypothetical protein
MSTVINDIDTSLNVLEQSASGTSSTNTAVYTMQKSTCWQKHLPTGSPS